MMTKFFAAALTLCVPIFTLQGSYSIENLNLEEKVGQVLMVHFNGEEANADAKTLIQEAHIGSIIYYNWSNGLNSPDQVRQLSEGLQKLAEQTPHSIPLLIATDQEGGVVARLTKGFTIFPGNRALAITKDLALTEQYAFISGEELQAVGVNMNLAPVVDVNNNPKNPLIGIRSFGDSPTEVIDLAKSLLKGYHSAGVITTLKHFPGHGDVEVDSHIDLPQIKKTKEELAQIELLPFTQLVNDADVIMTAHLMVKALDPLNCTTLSKSSLDFLRNDIGFKGVIISDSLVMEGLLKNCTSIDEAAIRALEAGCDLVMLGGKQLIGAHQDLEISVKDSLRIQQAIVNAVKSGRITKERLDQAVQRVLDLKNRYLSKHSPLLDKPLNTVVNTPEHLAIAKEIAERSTRIQKNTSLSIKTLAQSHVTLIAPEIVRGAIEQTSLNTIGNRTDRLFFKELNPSLNELQTAKDLTENTDITIFFTYNAWKNERQSDLVNALLNTNKPLIIIALKDPTDASLFPKASLVITTFSPTVPSIQAAADQLSKPNLWH